MRRPSCSPPCGEAAVLERAPADGHDRAHNPQCQTWRAEHETKASVGCMVTGRACLAGCAGTLRRLPRRTNLCTKVPSVDPLGTGTPSC